MLYNVVLFVEADKGERVLFADIKVRFRKKYIFFGKYYANLEIGLTCLNPTPMTKEDAELTSKLAYLAFRHYDLKRVEIQEAPATPANS